MFHNEFHLFTKKWKWSHGQYTHSGIRVRPETRKNGKSEKGLYISLKNSSADSKADFSEKSKLCVWRWILSRYDIILVKNNNAWYLIYKMTSLLNRVLNRALLGNYIALAIDPFLGPCHCMFVLPRAAANVRDADAKRQSPAQVRGARIVEVRFAAKPGTTMSNCWRKVQKISEPHISDKFRTNLVFLCVF